MSSISGINIWIELNKERNENSKGKLQPQKLQNGSLEAHPRKIVKMGLQPKSTSRSQLITTSLSN